MGDKKFYKGLLVLPLYEGSLDNVSGYAAFSGVFNVSDDEVDVFDKSFDPKEKKFQESQMEFETAGSMLDE